MNGALCVSLQVRRYYTQWLTVLVSINQVSTNNFHDAYHIALHNVKHQYNIHTNQAYLHEELVLVLYEVGLVALPPVLAQSVLDYAHLRGGAV